MTDKTRANEIEQEIFATELDSFVPDKILDSHSHMWTQTTNEDGIPPGFKEFDADVTMDIWRSRLDDLLPGRQQSALFLPLSIRGSIEDAELQNEWVSREAHTDSLSRPAMWISPNMDPDYVRQEVKRLRPSGFKCYHTESPRVPTYDSEIPEFLPEEHVRVAHDEGLTITLHMVKERSVSVASNQHWIKYFCEKYPNMNLILAHAARSFNPAFADQGMESLKGLQNLYCDTSAVAESGAFETIIRVLGHDRLLWGSDWAVSHARGKYVSVGYSWVWIEPDNVPPPRYAEQSPFVFNGLESLRALKQAATHTQLSDSQIEDIFFGNLAGVLGVEG
jgi:predicted TIM-barrel fold metal-dependent hydrolase